MKSPFFIVALPRSRTAWLSFALSRGGGICFHDLSAEMPIKEFVTVANNVSKKAAHIGFADTGLISYLPYTTYLFPQSPILVIHRKLEDCVRSLDDRVVIPEKWLKESSDRLKNVRDLWNGPVLDVSFEKIDISGRDIWKHLIGEGFDKDGWEMDCRWNVQKRPEYEFDRLNLRRIA